MQSWSFPQCLHLQPGLFASAVTGHVRVRKLAVQRAQCLQPADVHFSCAELELLSAFFVCIVCALCLFACVLCACSLRFLSHCYFRCVQLFNSLQVFRELTNMIHATEYLCSQRYLCALLHFVPVHFASGVTAHVRIVQSIAQRAEAVEM